MSQSFLMFALMLVIAAETCSLDSCKTDECKDHTLTDTTAATLPAGVVHPSIGEDCSTCDLTRASATWQGAGTSMFVFKIKGTCVTSGVSGVESTVVGSTGQHQAVLEPPSVIDICGNPAQVRWTTTFVHDSPTPLTNLTIAITCPRIVGG